MKNIYQSFEEIVEDMKNGEFIAHQLSDHSTDICEAWQTAVLEFARALDKAGVKLEESSEVYEKFWANVSDALVKWKAGLNRRQPYSKCLGTISKEEAKARDGVEGVARINIPCLSFNEISEDYYIVQ
jgi:hypothetical protein